MSVSIVKSVSEQIDMMSYSERMQIFNKLIKSFAAPAKTVSQNHTESFEAAFGMWKDRDISAESIRKKAWR